MSVRILGLPVVLVTLPGWRVVGIVLDEGNLGMATFIYGSANWNTSWLQMLPVDLSTATTTNPTWDM